MTYSRPDDPVPLGGHGSLKCCSRLTAGRLLSHEGKLVGRHQRQLEGVAAIQIVRRKSRTNSGRDTA